MNKRSLQKQEKINAILDYGIQAFREKGYHFAGVQELADSCKLSKGSFYQYFQTKENFCIQVIERYKEHTNVFFNEQFADESISGLESLKAFFSGLILMIEENNFQVGCLYGDLAAELGGVNERCSEALARCMDESGLIFQRVIERGQQDGSIRKDVDVASLSTLMMNSWTGVILRMKIESSRRVAEQFIDTFLCSMMAA